MKQDYERNIYYEQYVTRVTITLNTMYSDIDRVHKKVFGRLYPLGPSEGASRIVGDLLKGIRGTMCEHVHKHMRENKVTPNLWPLCEAGGKTVKECKLWKR